MVPLTSYSLVVLCALTLGHADFPSKHHKDEKPSDLPFTEQTVFSNINALVTVIQALRAKARVGGPFVKRKEKQDEEVLSIPRALHPKTLGCYSGSFEVNPNLTDPSYQKGIFKTPGVKYDALLRLSERGFMDWDTAMAVSVKMFGVPGKTIQPSFADADEKGTMDWLSFASASLTHSKQPDDPAFAQPASKILTPECYAAVGKSYSGDSVKRAQALNSFSGIGRHAEDFFNELFHMLVPNFTTPPSYDFTATGQHAFQFGEPTEPAFKWFWHMPGPKLEHNCGANGSYCISVDGFRSASEKILELPLELSLWGHLQGEGDPVELDTCWAPTEPMLLGKLVMKQDEKPRTCEHARFTPWHAPQEHRPLGSIGRMRGPILRNRHEARGALPCSQLDECRQNAEKRYESPSTPWFAVFGAALRLLTLLIKDRLGLGGHDDHGDDGHEGQHRALLVDGDTRLTSTQVMWNFLMVPFIWFIIFLLVVIGLLVVLGIRRSRDLKKQRAPKEGGESDQALLETR